LTTGGPPPVNAQKTPRGCRPAYTVYLFPYPKEFATIAARQWDARMDVDDTLLLENEPSEVSRAAAWLDELMEGAGLSPRAIAALHVALDEVLNNILIYGYADLEAHQIEVRVITNASVATLEFIDDGIPFDPTQHETAPGGAAQPGGLGLVFVRRVMDEMAYERVAERNHLTLQKFASL
jgi:serine/threonine-protein kinase RsbW